MLIISIDGLPAYLLDDPRVPMPTIRRLAREGAVAAGMRVINPSMTWPNHATIATGVRADRHGVLFNGRLLRAGPRRPVTVEHRDRDELVRVPTLYDLAHRAGLTTAHVDWIPHQVGGTMTWAFSEHPSMKNPLEQEMVAAGLLTAADVEEFDRQSITWRDEIWVRAATYIVRRHRPNLAYFHLLNLDAAHHRYGPRSVAGLSGVALADARLAQILEAAEGAGLRDRLTVFLVSDHGFKEVRRNIRGNAILRDAGLVEVAGSQVVGCDAWLVPAGGTAMVYLTNPDPARRLELLARARLALQAHEGVERVLEPPSFGQWRLPRIEDNDQMGELVAVAKAGYAFGTAAADGAPLEVVPDGFALGQHGYPADDPEMNAIFIAWGHGVRSGARLDLVDNVDVAPTVAALIGVEMKNVEGRVLRQILR